MDDLKKSEIPFERVLFFSDAIVAIAITLLALNLKLELPESHHLTIQDLLLPWKNYLAFFLSFINIASFWRRHHQMYTFIHKMNGSSMGYNICWLFFIIILPFSTSVLSSHFGDSAAIFLYSLNIFAISFFQYSIWKSSADQSDFIDSEKLPDEERKRHQIMFNLDMVNGLVCIILSFFVPKIAFFLLFFKIPVIFFGTVYIVNQRRKISKTEKEK
ncbi:TMEM175 family protein [Flavobacterium granuli]|uniref:Membrane protein n=1 Tax=Flavobacterium granuli TaxID=280093 RepID=A0ABU1RYY8_9FLAO|nr:TMEM175 family protein [Flavobacterium granuli]MDR6843983.1 putative membrane protein [Flavobacterium granuli]